MSIHPEDLALVNRIINGDQEAAEQFERKYLPRFKSIAWHAGVPSQDCADVAQDVFLAAVSQMQRGLFRGDSSLATWLVRILWGKIADYRRAKGRWQGLVQPGSAGDSEEEKSLIESVASPEVDFEAVAAVRETLERMPAQLRMILLLNRTVGFTIHEISQGMGLTVGQVSSRLYKAEELFRHLITSGNDRRLLPGGSAELKEGDTHD